MTPEQVFNAVLCIEAWPNDDDAVLRRKGTILWTKKRANLRISVIHIDTTTALARLKITNGQRSFKIRGTGKNKSRFDDYRWVGHPPTDADLVEWRLTLDDEFFIKTD